MAGFGESRLADVLRAAWQYPIAWVFMVFYIPLLLIALTLAGRQRRWRWVQPLVRLWARTLLAICRVKVVIEPPGTWPDGGRRIVTINHASTLDMIVVCAYWPPMGSGIVKQEFMRVPLLGQGAAAIGLVPVDRGSPERSRASLAHAADLMRRYDLSVILAPEGTRSKSGELLPFKLGAFHLGKAADAPIMPLVMHGPQQLWPRNRLSCRGGTVTVRQLPSIDLSQVDESDFRDVAEDLHRTYRETLAAMSAEPGDTQGV